MGKYIHNMYENVNKYMNAIIKYVSAAKRHNHKNDQQIKLKLIGWISRY